MSESKTYYRDQFTMSKHTPGKWSVKSDILMSNRSGAIGVTNENGLLIAAVRYSQALPKAEAEVNARLIAAAPELLAALERAYGDIIKFLNDGDFKKNVEWDAGYIVDAIAKAKGE